MKANVLVICEAEFDNYKLLIENLDRYLEPLIEFDVDICLHFDYDTNVCEDLIDYARVRRFDFKANTKDDFIHLKKSADYIVKNYDCAIIFYNGKRHDLRMVTDEMKKNDFKFRVINYLN